VAWAPKLLPSAWNVRFINVASAFDYLDAPLERITGFEVPTPYAINIEKLAFPSVENIVNAVNRVCYKKN